MESPYGGDPAFLETCHRWLLFHYHCKDCDLSEDACEYGKVCSYGKSTFTHVRGCTRAECSFPRCDLIKSILRHHEACKDESCQVCAPVRKYQARSKAPPPSPPQLPFAHVPAVTSATCASATSPMQCSDQQVPSQVQQPQQPQPHTQKRCSLKAELDQAQPQQTGPQYSTDPQSKSQPAGMLFEARHREQKRHLSSSLGRSSWTPDTATASGSSSGSGSGGCAMATAPSGSIEAAAELQALQLDKNAQQQQQPNMATGGQAQQTPEPLARQSAHPSLQEQLVSPGSRGGGGGSGSGTAGGGSLPPAGNVAQQQSRSAGPAPVLQMAAGLQQQQTQQLLQPPTQPLQQGGMSYGGTALTVLLQPPVQQQQHQQQPTVIMQPMQPRNPPQLQHQQPLVQHLPLSVAHHQPMFGTMQFITQPGALQASSQLQLSAQQPKPLQPFGGDAMAASGRNGSNASPYMSLPYGTMLQQPVQLGAAAPGMSYTVVHHHYGTAGPPTGTVLLPSTQPHQHHQQLQQQQFQQQQQHLHQVHPQQQQQPMILASGGHMPAGSGFFVGPQPVAGLAAPLGCGPGAAMDGSSGGGPGTTANWGTYQPSGFQHSLMLAQQQQQQQQQQMSGHFPAAAPGSTVTPMLVAPQLAGAGAT